MQFRIRTAAIAAVVCLLSILPAAGQTCPPPVITLAGGSNPTCAGVPVTLDAGSGWTTYQWSNGAATQTITDSPSTTTGYWVTTTDGNGCSVTSATYNVSVTPAPATPAIHPHQAAVCPGIQSDAYIDPPDPNSTWTHVDWRVDHGFIVTGDTTNAMVSFVTDPAGYPTTISATATDANGCTVTATSATVAVRTLTQPAIHLHQAAVCPGILSDAWIDPPDANSSWVRVVWSVDHGSIVDGDSTRVDFVTDPAGYPTIISATATDASGCSVTTTSAPVAVRTLTPPVIHPHVPAVCPGLESDAWIDPPDANSSWASVVWSVDHGLVVSGDPAGVVFVTDPAGSPTVITAVAKDQYGCSTTATVTVAARVLNPAITLQSASVCAGSSDSAVLDPPDANSSWANVTWSIDHGTITASSTSSVSFLTDPAGSPAVVTAVATDSYGCSVTVNSSTVGVQTITAPAMHFEYPAVCPGSYDYVVLDPPDQNSQWANVKWSVDHGTITYSSTTGMSFNTDPAGFPAVVTAVVTDANGCTATATSPVIAVRTIQPPAMHLEYSAVCPGSSDFVGIDPPDPYSQWHNVQWSVDHGTITFTSNNSMTFNTDPAGLPAVVTVSVTDDYGCTVIATSPVIGVRTIQPPAMHLEYGAVCPGSSDFVGIDPPDPYSQWHNVQWSVDHGTITYTSNDSMTFNTDPAGLPAVVTVSVTDDYGCTVIATSPVIGVRTIQPPAMYLEYGAVCPGSYDFVGIDPPSQYSQWHNVQWSVDHGTITYTSNNSMTFNTDPAGLPAVVSVTVTDDYGCIVTATSPVIAVRTIAPPAMHLAYPAVCPGSSDFVGIDPPDTSSQWQNVQWSVDHGTLVYPSNSSVTVNTDPSGVASVVTAVVTDDYGCSTSATTTIPVHSVTATINVDVPPSCPGSNAQVSLAAPADTTTSWTNIQWSVTNGTIVDGATAATMHFQLAPASSSGTVSVTATDSMGCTATNTVTVTGRALTPPTLTLDTPTLCASGNGQAHVDPPADPTDWWVNEQWSITHGTIVGGGTTVNFTLDGSGLTATLGAVLTDAYGCTTSVSLDIPVSTASSTTQLSVNHPTTCPGNVVQVATWNYDLRTFAWSVTNGTISGPANTNAINVVAGSGTVTVALTATNVNGCTVTGSTTIDASAAPPNTTITAPATLCPGATFTASVPDAGPNATYSWTATGATLGFNSATANFTTTSATSVELDVTVTVNGCSASGTVTVPVSSPVKPSITPSGPTSFCAGGSVTLTSTAAASYRWSNGASTQSITVSSAGAYHVTTTDANGCSATSDDVAISVLASPATPAITAGGPTTFCAGGAVTLTAPGGYTYSWSNGATTQSITVGATGSYSATVTDANGCSATSAPTNVTAKPLPTPTITGGPICGGAGNLYASTADTYLWSTGDTTQGINITQAGSYTVTVTTNGCSATSQPYTVQSFPPPPNLYINSAPGFACPSETDTATVFGGENFVSLKWTVTNGTINGPDNGTSLNFTTGASGTTELNVIGTDANGCRTGWTHDVTISLPDATISTNPVACSNAQASVNYLPNPPGTTYQWTLTNATILSGATSSAVNFAPVSDGPITITATVTWPGGCSTTGSRTITGSVFPQVTYSIPDHVCTPAGNTASVSDAGPNAVYQWSGAWGATITSDPTQRSVTFSISGASGLVGVSVKKSDGTCYQATSKTVTLDQPAVTISADRTTACPGGTAHLSATGSNYYTPPSYLWSNGATTAAIDVGAGTYSVTLTDAAGCSVTSNSITITTDALPAPVLSVSPASYCSTTTTVNATVTNASSYSTFWFRSNGSVQTINGPNAMVVVPQPSTSLWVAVDATDANGCTATTRVDVPLTATPDATITMPDTVCDGNDIVASVPDAGAGATYSWDVSGGVLTSGNGTSRIHYTPSLINPSNPNVSVSVTITTAAGCTKQGIHDAAVNPSPQASITLSAPAPLCEGANYTATTPDAGPGATYRWTIANGTIVSGDITNTITFYASFAGNPVYLSVAVTGTNGCTRTVNIAPQVVGTPAARIDAGGPTEFCQGGSVTLTASGTPDIVSYRWSNGATGNTLVATQSGAYSVTVTNASGCSSTTAPTQVTVDPLPAATITAGGPTTFCAGGSVTLTAPSGASYSWSNGATTQAITVTNSGAYRVTVTSASGCSATSATTNVTVNPLPTATITAGGPTTFCSGGSVTLTASSGASYAWSNGATTQSITVNSSGAYSVTVTNGNGCSATSAPTNVTVNPLPTATITAGGPTTFCAGGSVTLTASSGASYAWSNGATTQSITVNSSGAYSVTVTTASGCSATSAPTNVTVNPLPTATITAGGPTTFCSGGSVTLTASSGASYAWSNGATTQSITVNSSGAYSVTVTNGNGCSATSAATNVTVNPLPTATITAGGPTTFCAGGSVTLTASSGASYAWSNGATTQAITVNGSGAYSVTVTTASGCSATSAVTNVTVNPLPTATITAGGPTTFCAGGSVTLTASSGATYSWSNGATTQAITVNSSGAYSVTVTTASGCSATSAMTNVTVNPLPTATITAGGPTTFCAGGSVTLTASSGASYSWSNGATTQSITVNSSGAYSVTVTDANGCSATSAATNVTVNPLPTATITAGGPTTFCAGGSVTLTASSGASYAWSNGATTQSITVNSSGAYRVTLTDANGCSATSAATNVTVNPLPTATILAGGRTALCAGDSVTLLASSGASYSWSNGATTPSITVSSAGAYSVTVTDANGCSATSAPTNITVNPLPTATITANGPTSFCPGGSVVLTASSGSSYWWSNGATTQSVTLMASGDITVQVGDANGCSATSAPTTVTVNPNPPTPTITASGPTTFCAGDSVTLTAPSGYTYRWANGATTQSITVTTSGVYNVKVTDANGCSATSDATTITENGVPAATITASGPTTFCAGGSVTLTASSGTGFSYAWSTGATTQSITVNASGAYSVTVSAPNGCSTISSPTTVTVNPNPTTPTITAGGPTTFCVGGSVTLTASTGPSYFWSNGARTQSITVNSSGSYSVMAVDANGCSATSTATTVTVNPLPTAAITAGGPTTFCAGGSVTLTASSGASYSWSNGATTQSISASSAGAYSVTVTDANGCSATSAATNVSVIPLPATTITAGGPTTFCAGGSVTLSAPGGYSYAWSNGATTQSITVNSSGAYSVTVTNANGCSATSAPTNVTVNALPAATITAGGPTTFCAGGSVTLTASSGASYSWSNGATTQSITVNSSGSYTVTVTNANGCSATSPATVVTVNANPPTPTITAGGPTTFCAGGSVTLTASSGSSYSWSNGATTQSITVNSSGAYSVTVRNASGCSATSAATNVTVNPAPSITGFGPTSQSVLKSHAAQPITVTASGTGTLTYQWYKGTSGTTTSPISGATTNSYNPPTGTRGTFNYWVRVTIGTCTADSATATVTVQ